MSAVGHGAEGVAEPTDLVGVESAHPLGEVLVPLTDDPGVLVGNVFGLADATDVDHVVSLCRTGATDLPSQARRHPIHLIDTPGANPNLAVQLRDLAETIAIWRADGQRVLIHCVRAESRTPSVAAAYLAHGRAGQNTVDSAKDYRTYVAQALVRLAEGTAWAELDTNVRSGCRSFLRWAQTTRPRSTSGQAALDKALQAFEAANAR